MPGENSGPDPTQPFSFNPGAYGTFANAFGQPQVYWGQKPGGYDAARDALRQGLNSRGDHTRSVDESAIAFYTDFTDSERKSWADRMYKSGFINDPNNIEAAFDAWKGAVSRASDMYMLAGKKVTPWQAMDLMEGINGGAGRKPVTRTSTSTSTDVPAVEDANAMVDAVFRNAFGRAPNDAELSRYRSMLIRKARSHPRTTTTTQTTDLQGNVTSNSTSRGGYSETAMQYDALQRAQADPEFGAYQAATTYFNALIGALDAPG